MRRNLGGKKLERLYLTEQEQSIKTRVYLGITNIIYPHNLLR